MPEKFVLEEFLDGYMYHRKAYLIDEIVECCQSSRTIEALVHTNRELLVTPYQSGDPKYHPRHVSGADMVMMTVNLGSLHAYLFHACRWKEGWIGYGGKMKQVSFKSLAEIGPPLRLQSKEMAHRKSQGRIVIEFSFEFSQENRTVYKSHQTAVFLNRCAQSLEQ